MVHRVLHKEGRVRFKAGRPDLRARLLWERGFKLSWEFGASVASRVESWVGLSPLFVFLGVSGLNPLGTSTFDPRRRSRRLSFFLPPGRFLSLLVRPRFGSRPVEGGLELPFL